MNRDCLLWRQPVFMRCDGEDGPPGRNTDGVECNVRVVVRVRPLVARERLAGATESLEVIPGTPQIVVNPEHSYAFDQVQFIL